MDTDVKIIISLSCRDEAKAKQVRSLLKSKKLFSRKVERGIDNALSESDEHGILEQIDFILIEVE